ncbi:MAG: isoleucine--tRNA ligase [Methanosarcinales archaeon Met12]|nr:MAG: isoleucine--tRNA ligase [Methanosarcinales archaeon Met12]
MKEEVAGQYDSHKVEERVIRQWNEAEAYKRTREHRKGSQRFYFVDGPPYTTGAIHLGTAWNKIIKDVVLRFKSMKGFDVLDRAGWDMHGLPIEVKVEEHLGFKTKKDIEAYGSDRFIDECKRFALQNKEQMTAQFKRLGAWLDWDDPYMTIDDGYIEAAWWTIKQAHKKGLLEGGKRVVNWCSRCETAIADSEVEYWDRTDPSIYVKFPVSRKSKISRLSETPKEFRLVGEDDTHIVIWTTTPWTIPSNIAVAVHSDFKYSKVRAWDENRDEILIMASELVENVLKEGHYQDYEVLETMRGRDLVGLEYENPLSDVVPAQAGFEHKVYLADFVTVENTGCVHIAPGHGMDDFGLGTEHELPIFCPVGPDGRYTAYAGKYVDMYVFDANPQVIEDLDKKGVLLAHGNVTHRYGHCWRCKTPIIYLATEQWFLKVSELKDSMLKEIEKVEWHPRWAGSARFKDWIEGARDWCISRQRYWGIPLPIWICECGSMDVIGTRDELEKRAGDLPDDMELHRPDLDKIRLKCPKCTEDMRRVEDVFDVWFDSAIASWAGLDFPHKSGAFDTWWPADFITEGHDQTRGWFYSQLGASMIAFGRAPYKSVLMHGFTLDDLGRKMSKSMGNVVTPEDVINRYGADTLRFYVLSSNAPWEDLRFIIEDVQNAHRMLNILWNVYRFPLPYMALDNFDPSAVSSESVKSHLRIEDKWVLSKVNSLILEVEDAMARYELHRATRALQNFIVEDLSRWYIRLIRPRMWIEEDDPDKFAAYRTIWAVTDTIVKLMAPFTPFIAEDIYQNVSHEGDVAMRLPTVHMCDWTVADKKSINKTLEAHMDVARRVVEAASNARQKAKRKLRWPVKVIVIAPDNDAVNKAVKSLESVIKEQANTKELIVLEAGEEWEELGLKVVPNPNRIGPEFKGRAGKVIDALKKIDGRVVKRKIARGYELKLPDGEVLITEEMVGFEESVPEHISVAEFSGGRIYVDVELTDELIAEGYAREVIRRIQDMRRELNLDMMDKIDVSMRIQDGRVVGLMSAWRDFISGEVRAESLNMGIDITIKGDLVKKWTIENIEMEFGIGKCEMK